jgi:hypothetical protein
MDMAIRINSYPERITITYQEPILTVLPIVRIESRNLPEDMHPSTANRNRPERGPLAGKFASMCQGNNEAYREYAHDRADVISKDKSCRSHPQFYIISAILCDKVILDPPPTRRNRNQFTWQAYIVS